MDEARITITVKPIYIERIVYWVIIAALLVLLTLVYLREPEAAGQGQQSQQEQQGTQAGSGAQAQAPVTPTAQEPDEPEDTCDDGRRSGDETDVDCGGSCGKCATGKACEAASDCTGGYCTSGKCASSAPVALSGKLEATLTKVDFSKAANGRVKVTGIGYSLKNGLGESTGDLLVKVYVKSKNGRCLNQQVPGTCDDSYAEFAAPSVASGQTAPRTVTFDSGTYTTRKGAFLLDDNGYDPLDSAEDDFMVTMYVYDQDGNEIDGKAVSASKTTNP